MAGKRQSLETGLGAPGRSLWGRDPPHAQRLLLHQVDRVGVGALVVVPHVAVFSAPAQATACWSHTGDLRSGHENRTEGHLPCRLRLTPTPQAPDLVPCPRTLVCSFPQMPPKALSCSRPDPTRRAQRLSPLPALRWSCPYTLSFSRLPLLPPPAFSLSHPFCLSHSLLPNLPLSRFVYSLSSPFCQFSYLAPPPPSLFLATLFPLAPTLGPSAPSPGALPQPYQD